LLVFVVLVLVYVYSYFGGEWYINYDLDQAESQTGALLDTIIDWENQNIWNLENNENTGLTKLVAESKDSSNSVEVTDQQARSLFNQIKWKPHSIDGYYFGVVYAVGIENNWWVELTDVIKLIAYNENTKDLVMIGIPRDWRIEYDGEQMKINYVYEHIKQSGNYKGKELRQLTRYVSKLLDVPIHYYAKLDFELFENFIDIIGGIDVCVDKDYYEDGEKVLDKGCQTLSWEDALMFTRTRQQDNDFFRSLRQNHAIYSIINKTKKLSFVQMLKVSKEFIDSVETNLKIWEIAYAWRYFLDFEKRLWVALNSQCDFYDGQFSEKMKFCLFYDWYDETYQDFYLRPIKDIESIRHYIKTLIYHPDIVNCEFNGILNYKEQINLMNVGVELNKFQFKNDFVIDSLSGCDRKDINYFIGK